MKENYTRPVIDSIGSLVVMADIGDEECRQGIKDIINEITPYFLYDCKVHIGTKFGYFYSIDVKIKNDRADFNVTEIATDADERRLFATTRLQRRLHIFQTMREHVIKNVENHPLKKVNDVLSKLMNSPSSKADEQLSIDDKRAKAKKLIRP